MPEPMIYVNGKTVTKSEAKVSVFDEGVTHGWAVYEGIRVYEGRILELEAHINRLYDSAKGAFIKIPISKNEFKSAIIDTVKANGYMNAHIAPWVSYGERGGEPSIVVRIRSLDTSMGKEVQAIIASTRRTGCDSIDPKIKTNSRLDLMLASVEASNAGVDYAIMLDKEGYVAEASMANLLIVKNGKVYTPQTTSALEGVTKQIITDSLRQEDYQVEEKTLTMQDLYSADEILICGTGAEIKPVVEIDGRIVGEGKMGPVTSKTIELYWGYIKRHGEQIL